MVTKTATRRRTTSQLHPMAWHDHDKDWAILMARVQTAYHRAVVRGNGHMFQTDASDLFRTFLFHIPEYEKQIHNRPSLPSAATSTALASLACFCPTNGSGVGRSMAAGPIWQCSPNRPRCSII